MPLEPFRCPDESDGGCGGPGCPGFVEDAAADRSSVVQRNISGFFPQPKTAQDDPAVPRAPQPGPALGSGLETIHPVEAEPRIEDRWECLAEMSTDVEEYLHGRWGLRVRSGSMTRPSRPDQPSRQAAQLVRSSVAAPAGSRTRLASGFPNPRMTVTMAAVPG